MLRLIIAIFLVGCGSDEGSNNSGAVAVETTSETSEAPRSGQYMIETSDFTIECSDGSTAEMNGEIEQMYVSFNTDNTMSIEGLVLYVGNYTSSNRFNVETEELAYGTDDYGDYSVYRQIEGTATTGYLSGEFYMLQTYADGYCEYFATLTAEEL